MNDTVPQILGICLKNWLWISFVLRPREILWAQGNILPYISSLVLIWIKYKKVKSSKYQQTKNFKSTNKKSKTKKVQKMIASKISKKEISKTEIMFSKKGENVNLNLFKGFSHMTTTTEGWDGDSAKNDIFSLWGRRGSGITDFC